MATAPVPSRGAPPVSALTGLAIALLLQCAISFLNMAMPVLGPVITKAAGIAPERIGLLNSIHYAGAIWFLTVSGPLLARTGPLRLLQLGCLLSASAMAVIALGWWPLLMLSALMLGIGYGPQPPAGSAILAATAPAHRRGIVFSIKQAGVPLGGAIAGVLLPALALWLGWQGALLAAGGIMLGCVMLTLPFRERLDSGRDPAVRIRARHLFSPANLLNPARALRLHPELPLLSFTAAAFAFVQGCTFAYLVTFLVEGRGMALAVAGLAFSTMQTVGIASRVVTGWLGDLIGSTRMMVILLGTCSAAMAVTLTCIGGDWPFWVVGLVCGAAGFAVASWNGVYLAEIARIAPPGKVGEATAGSTVFTFLGYFAGPGSFSLLVAWTGRYETGFLTAAAVMTLATIALVVSSLRFRRNKPL